MRFTFRIVKYSTMKHCGFFIGSNSENIILIIPFGSVHVFSQLKVVNKEVEKQARKMQESVIDVYVDILPFAGNKTKTLLKFTYDRLSGTIDWTTAEEFTFQEIPSYLLSNIKRIYREHRESFLEFLLPSERKKFEAIIS